MSSQYPQRIEEEAAKVAWALRGSGVDNRYLHSAARFLLEQGQSTRDGVVIAEAKRRHKLTVDNCESNLRRLGKSAPLEKAA